MLGSLLPLMKAPTFAIPVGLGAFPGCCSKTPALGAPHNSRDVPALKCSSEVGPPPFSSSSAAFPHPPLVLLSVS